MHELLFLAGVCLLVAGVALVSIAAALIVAGLSVMVLAYLQKRDELRRAVAADRRSRS